MLLQSAPTLEHNNNSHNTIIIPHYGTYRGSYKFKTLSGCGGEVGSASAASAGAAQAI